MEVAIKVDKEPLKEDFRPLVIKSIKRLMLIYVEDITGFLLDPYNLTE